MMSRISAASEQEERPMRKICGYLGRVCRAEFLPSGACRIGERIASEQGAALVEMAIACTLLITLLLGIIQVSLALYVHNLLSEAARDATRYATVRGANSCTYANPTMPDCNLGPTSSGNAIQSYVQGLGYPFARSLNATATWWSPTGGIPNAWTGSCTTLLDTGSGPLGGSRTYCNSPGHAVKVQVTYTYPLAIPFWGKAALSMGSTSEMVINFGDVPHS